MAFSAIRLIFIVARLGGFIVICLALVSLRYNFTRVDSIATAADGFVENERPSSTSDLPRIPSKAKTRSTTSLWPLFVIGPISPTNKKHCKGDSLYSQKGATYVVGKHKFSASKIGILFRGEAFRTKMKAAMDRRVANQLQASESHVIFLLRDLYNEGFQIDVYAYGSIVGDIPTSEAESKLKDLYAPWAKVSLMLQSKKFESQGEGFFDAVHWFLQRAGVKSAKDLLYDFVFVLRFDIVFTSSAMPPFINTSLPFTHVLYAMRDADFGWKSLSYVHDSMQWIPKKYFRSFFEGALGDQGCYAKSKHWYAGSGHGCWITGGHKQIQQGFFHEGCFAVKDTHPFYYLTEMRRKR